MKKLTPEEQKILDDNPELVMLGFLAAMWLIIHNPKLIKPKYDEEGELGIKEQFAFSQHIRKQVKPKVWNDAVDEVVDMDEREIQRNFPDFHSIQ